MDVAVGERPGRPRRGGEARRRIRDLDVVEHRVGLRCAERDAGPAPGGVRRAGERDRLGLQSSRQQAPVDLQGVVPLGDHGHAGVDGQRGAALDADPAGQEIRAVKGRPGRVARDRAADGGRPGARNERRRDGLRLAHRHGARANAAATAARPPCEGRAAMSRRGQHHLRAGREAGGAGGAAGDSGRRGADASGTAAGTRHLERVRRRRRGRGGACLGRGSRGHAGHDRLQLVGVGGGRLQRDVVVRGGRRGDRSDGRPRRAVGRALKDVVVDGSRIPRQVDLGWPRPRCSEPGRSGRRRAGRLRERRDPGRGSQAGRPVEAGAGVAQVARGARAVAAAGRVVQVERVGIRIGGRIRRRRPACPPARRPTAMIGEEALVPP